MAHTNEEANKIIRQICKETKQLENLTKGCKCNEEIIQAVDRIQFPLKDEGSEVKGMKQSLSLKGRLQDIKFQ
mgnify:CR=1 FL=1